MAVANTTTGDYIASKKDLKSYHINTNIAPRLETGHYGEITKAHRAD